MSNKVVWITKNGVLAAIYVVLTLVFAPLSFGAVQFRVSELLMMVPFFNKKWIPGLAIGCAIANMNSPLGVIDIVFGTLGTLVSAYLITKFKNIYVAALIPSVLNGLFVGTQLWLIFQAPLFATMVYVSLGELVVVMISSKILLEVSKNVRVKKHLYGE